MSRSLTAGGECDAWCTKCKRDAVHNIVAMDSTGKTPAQVQCRSCQGTHKYRPPKETPAAVKATKATATKAAGAAKVAGAKPATKKVSKAAANTAVSIYKRWEELVGKRAGVAAQPYAVTKGYGLDDVVEHTQFGLGFVLEEIAYNRIKVLFQDSERTLLARHGQKPPSA